MPVNGKWINCDIFTEYTIIQYSKTGTPSETWMTYLCNFEWKKLDARIHTNDV